MRSGGCGRWWLPGTSSIAPSGDVNSSIARNVLTEAT
jgi:hypothetical protein